jgi:hypothetical protein
MAERFCIHQISAKKAILGLIACPMLMGFALAALLVVLTRAVDVQSVFVDFAAAKKQKKNITLLAFSFK